MPNLNTRLFEFVNNAVGYYRPLDVLFIIATSFYTLVVVGIVVIYYMGFYVPMKQKGITHIQTLKHMGMVVLSLAVTFVTVSIIKVAVAFPRPFKTLPNLHVLISLPTDYSFPSGHAALTMALATAVYCYHKRLGEVLFAFALIVGLARVYVGVHYPLDVGVGFLLGYLIPKLLQHYFIKKESLKLQ